MPREALFLTPLLVAVGRIGCGPQRLWRRTIGRTRLSSRCSLSRLLAGRQGVADVHRRVPSLYKQTTDRLKPCTELLGAGSNGPLLLWLRDNPPLPPPSLSHIFLGADNRTPISRKWSIFYDINCMYICIVIAFMVDRRDRVRSSILKFYYYLLLRQRESSEQHS